VQVVVGVDLAGIPGLGHLGASTSRRTIV